MTQEDGTNGEAIYYAGDVARKFNVDVRTVHRWVKQGKLVVDGVIGRSPIFNPGEVTKKVREEGIKRQQELLERERKRQRSKKLRARRRAARRRRRKDGPEGEHGEESN